MAITADLYSSELTQVRAPGNAPIAPNEMHGRMRIARFTYETPVTTGVVDGQNIAACILPKGARVLRIFLAWEDMGTGVAVDVGLMGNDGSGFIDAANSVADDDALFAAAVDLATAGETTVADTIAENYGYETEKECLLVLTAETGDWDAEQDIIGHVEYVVD